jgi:hypothetical protein
MVKKIRRFMVLSVLLVLLLPSGCSWMMDACDATNSTIGVVGAYVDEAQFAVQSARKVAMTLPDAIKPDGINAVNVAEASLFSVAQLATTATEQCDAIDLPKMFKDFAEAWDKVKQILDKTGGASSLGVIDPKAYGLGKGAK